MKKSSSFPLEPWLQVARCATSIDEELHKVQAIIQCQQSFETRSTIGGLRELSKIWHLYSMLHFWFLLVRMIYDIYSMFLERCAGKILRNLVSGKSSFDYAHVCRLPASNWRLVLQYETRCSEDLSAAIQWKSFKMWHCRPAAGRQRACDISAGHLSWLPPRHRRRKCLPSAVCLCIKPPSAVCLSLPSTNY